LTEALGPEAAWRKKSPVERGSGFDALYDVLAEMGRAVEADIPAEGAARYLYHIFRKLGYNLPAGRREPVPCLRLRAPRRLLPHVRVVQAVVARSPRGYGGSAAKIYCLQLK
jgi:hypothetical protein